MDFSARALPIGVKFWMAVRPHLGIAPGMAEFGHKREAILWRDMLLAEALLS